MGDEADIEREGVGDNGGEGNGVARNTREDEVARIR